MPTTTKATTKGAKSPRPNSAADAGEASKEARDRALAAFLKKDFGAAADAYEQAIKLLPASAAADKADLQQKRAGCFMQLQRYKEAVKECTAALEAVPNASTALKTRSKAYEQLALYKQAHADMQALNRTQAATDETRAAEKRLKEAMAAKSKSPAGLGSGGLASRGAGRSAASSSAAAAAAAASNYSFTVKVQSGSEIRSLQCAFTVTYGELLEAARAQFPGAGPAVLKYTDKAGDEITITGTHDIQVQLHEVLANFQRLAKQGLPPPPPQMKVKLVPVASEADVPKAPAEEYLLGARRPDQLFDAQAQPPPQEPVEDWIVEFVRTFQDLTGLDFSSSYDGQHQAADKLQRAMDVALSEEKALPLFDAVGEHCCDATVQSLVQWGQAFVVKAERRIQAAIKGGKKLSSEAMAAAFKDYELAEEKYKQALGFKAQSPDAYSALAALEYERVKVKIGGFVEAPPMSDDDSKTVEQRQQEQQELIAERLKAAFAAVTKAQMDEVQPLVQRSLELFEKAVSFAKAEDERKKKRAAELDAADAELAAAAGRTPVKREPLTPEQEALAQQTSVTANMCIMAGNIMYEWSQVLAATGSAAWRDMLDKAVARFRESGAPEPDIRAALKQHHRKDELDLGPDPEPEAAPAPAPAAEQQKAAARPSSAKQAPPDAKGLPSLEVKKKKEDKK